MDNAIGIDSARSVHYLHVTEPFPGSGGGTDRVGH